jgi:hypothetical protein
MLPQCLAEWRYLPKGGSRPIVGRAIYETGTRPFIQADAANISSNAIRERERKWRESEREVPSYRH